MGSRKSTDAIQAELAALDIEILDDEFRDAAENDHMFFCRHVLGYKDLNDDLHGEVSRIVNDCTKMKKLLLLPRGHLKSSLVTVGWTLWLIVNDPNRTIGIFNETQDLAEAFLREIKDNLEQNPVLKKYWPHLLPEKRGRGSTGEGLWNRSAIILNRSKLSRTPTVEAKSIDESTAGRHPDVMILDDPISDRTVRTDESIRKSIQRFQELQALLEPPSADDIHKSKLIVIGTRWHWQDLYHYIMDNLEEFYDVYVRRCIENERVIFPEKFTKAVLREMRQTMKEWVFSSQMMNEPVDSEAAVFPHSLLRDRTWKDNRERFLERIPNLTYLAVDPAWEGEDSTGIVCGARAENGKLYVLESLRIKLNPDQMLETVVGVALRWRVHRIGFEGVVGGQEWMIKNLRDLLHNREMTIPVVSLSHGNRSKNARLIGLVPELQYKRLYLHAEGCQPLIQELLQYPRSSYRDCMDACEMLTRISAPPGRTRSVAAHNVPGTGEFEMQQLEKEGRRRMRQRGRRRSIR